MTLHVAADLSPPLRPCEACDGAGYLVAVPEGPQRHAGYTRTVCGACNGTKWVIGQAGGVVPSASGRDRVQPHDS
jgi:hypothetical protein